MIQINTRYIRTAPDGDQSIVLVTTEAELTYHQDLETNEGFTYKEVSITVVPDSSCISCEG